MKKLPTMKNYIYCLSHPITNEVVYIGKTKNPKNRYKNHCSKDKNHYATRLSMWKHHLFLDNLKPEFFIIDEFESEIDYWEIHYIRLFRYLGVNLLNMTEGGDGLQNPSAETRRKIGEKSRGRKMSEKTKEKIFIATYNSGKKIVCYDINENLIEYFNNSRRASEKLNVSYKNISDILNGGMNFNRGYTFFFQDDTNIEEKLKIRISKTTKLGQKIYRIDKYGIFTNYDNLMCASRENNLSFKNIWLCLNKKRKTCGDFAWIYESEISDVDYNNFFNKKTKGFKVSAYNENKNEYMEFNSLTEASNHFSMKRSTISKYIEECKSRNGYKFKYII